FISRSRAARKARVARAGPAVLHEAGGPGNSSVAIQSPATVSLCRPPQRSFATLPPRSVGADLQQEAVDLGSEHGGSLGQFIRGVEDNFCGVADFGRGLRNFADVVRTALSPHGGGVGVARDLLRDRSLLLR